MQRILVIMLVSLLCSGVAQAAPNTGAEPQAVPGLIGTVGNDATLYAMTQLEEFGGIDGAAFTHIYVAGDTDADNGWGAANATNDCSSPATPCLGFVRIKTGAGLSLNNKPKLWIHVKGGDTVTDSGGNDYFKRALFASALACGDKDAACLVISSDYGNRATLDCGTYTDISANPAILQAAPGSAGQGWLVVMNLDITCDHATDTENIEAVIYGQIAILNVSSTSDGSGNALARPILAATADNHAFCVNCEADAVMSSAVFTGGAGSRYSFIGSGQPLTTEATDGAGSEYNGGIRIAPADGDYPQLTAIGHKIEHTGFDAAADTYPTYGGSMYIQTAALDGVSVWLARNLLIGGDAHVSAGCINALSHATPTTVNITAYQNTLVGCRNGFNTYLAGIYNLVFEGNIFYGMATTDGVLEEHSFRFASQLNPASTIRIVDNLVDGSTGVNDDAVSCVGCVGGTATYEIGAFTSAVAATQLGLTSGNATITGNVDLNGVTPFLSDAGGDGPGYICKQGAPCEGAYTTTYTIPLAQPAPPFVFAGQRGEITHLNLNTSGVGNAGWQ